MENASEKKEHKTCKKTLLRRIQKISHILDSISDMRADNCPATIYIDAANLRAIRFELAILRRAAR